VIVVVVVVVEVAVTVAVLVVSAHHHTENMTTYRGHGQWASHLSKPRTAAVCTVCVRV
jgi:hypothetical protein